MYSHVGQDSSYFWLDLWLSVCIISCFDLTYVRVKRERMYTLLFIHTCTWTHLCWTHLYWQIDGFCDIHRKSSLYLPLGSVNLVLKAMGIPDEISSPPGWNRVSPGCPRNFNTELTEPTRQIKTTFPMNMYECAKMNASCHMYEYARITASCPFFLCCVMFRVCVASVVSHVWMRQYERVVWHVVVASCHMYAYTKMNAMCQMVLLCHVACLCFSLLLHVTRLYCVLSAPR